MNQKLFLFTILLAQAFFVEAQNISLSMVRKMPSGSREPVDKISFSGDSKFMATTDRLGGLCMIEVSTTNLLRKDSGFGDIFFHDFVDNGNIFLTLKRNGSYYTHELPSFKRTKGLHSFKRPLFVTLDPVKQYLTVIKSNNEIEIFDLKSSTVQSVINVEEKIRRPKYVEFDSLGKQLASVNNIGENYNWEVSDQQLTDKKRFESHRYSGSASTVLAVARDLKSGTLIVGMQEIFRSKGTNYYLRYSSQAVMPPIRKNAVAKYDWESGAELKRISVDFRVDDLVIDPVSSDVIFLNKENKTLCVVHFDTNDVKPVITLNEQPTALAISDDGKMIAVGTVSGMVYLYSIIPAYEK